MEILNTTPTYACPERYIHGARGEGGYIVKVKVGVDVEVGSDIKSEGGK